MISVSELARPPKEQPLLILCSPEKFQNFLNARDNSMQVKLEAIIQSAIDAGEVDQSNRSELERFVNKAYDEYVNRRKKGN